ncbi:hypothetical protein MYX07_07050 [Patescibacteria group bacterium AH-259-L07]|nr:hypothetical protein [Patescibacteria group bacterium AH-259-L07]
MNKNQNHIQHIDPDIRRDFPQDPMMQKLHQIRRELIHNQSIKKTLKYIEETTRTKSVRKTG